jgi:hypothetical protein
MGIRDFYQLPIYLEYKKAHAQQSILIIQTQVSINFHDIHSIHDIYAELEHLLFLLYSLCPRIGHLHDNPREYTSYRQKSALYAEFLHDIRQLGHWISCCATHDPKELQEELKEFCDKLLTLYGQTVIALEKLLYRAQYYCKRAPFAYNTYCTSSCEEYFKACIYKVTTHDRLSSYFVDVACLFDQLRRTLSYIGKSY